MNEVQNLMMIICYCEEYVGGWGTSASQYVVPHAIVFRRVVPPAKEWGQGHGQAPAQAQ